MEYELLNVEMTPELFDRSIKGSPKEAIKELIWNACDADALHIEVSFLYDGIAGPQAVSDIYVKDDGHGIPFENVAEYFGKYGCSQKAYSDKSPSGRIYHGKLGQGRYKSLAIGCFVDWETTYIDSDGKYLSYNIQIDAGTKMGIRFSKHPQPSKESHSGTVVHVHGIQDNQINATSKLAENSEMIPDLLSTFAPYLMAYNCISVHYNGVTLNPDNQIERRKDVELVFDKVENEKVKAKAIAIQWKQTQFSKLYIGGSSGVVYLEQEYSPLKKHLVSIYLLSDYFERMHRENTLDMGLADPVYADLNEQVKEFALKFMREQDEQDATFEILKLKEDGLYPFDGEAKDEITRAEQSVFDVLAVEINRAVPQLRTAHRQTKKLTYRLMREAIYTNPSSIKTILEEVFNLSHEQQDQLAELLTHTHLPEIIDIAKTVSDRLTFIYLLEQIVYNDSVGRPIKERTQFHRLLLKELWIFGEKYAIGTSDQSLKNLLKAHIKCLGRDELIPNIPPEATEDLTRIPDICLFQQICPGYEQYEHLVIELKRPTLTLGKKELDQIEDYAMTVSENPMFDKSATKWHFILLGQDFDKTVVNRLKNRTQGAGNFYNAEDGSVSISVLKWASVIQENKFKYEFLRKKLNHELSSDPDFAMDYLFEKHAELFSSQNRQAT